MEQHVDNATYRDLVCSAANLLSHYFIGFVNLQDSDDGGDASIGGSGTLVSVCDVKGVLTAGHVIDSILKQEHVGIVLATGSPQRVLFKTNYCKPIAIQGTIEKDGPDLGFLMLPPDTIGTLGAIMSFYNLTKNAERLLTKPPPLDYGIWGITGFAEEFTRTRETPLKGYSKAKIFKGSFGAGKVTGEEERDQYDYLQYEALYNQLYEGPDSFAGHSGGGLWQLTVDLSTEKPEIRERLLVGVAFYETQKFETQDGLVRRIICHGRKSIYQNLLEDLRNLK